MIRLLQIVPVPECRLFGQIVKKEIEISRSNRGTFFRSGAKERDRAKWSHAKFNGWIKLQRTDAEVVAVEIRSLSHTRDEWQIFHAFLGWLDRYFSDQVQSINVQYRG